MLRNSVKCVYCDFTVGYLRKKEKIIYETIMKFKLNIGNASLQNYTYPMQNFKNILLTEYIICSDNT